ncbi:MAG: Holliday junction branch migration DNA helicase RuvB [Patescibacteria group bacterium]
MDDEHQITTAEGATDERLFEVGLRPQTLTEFIGQHHIKDNLSVFMEAARGRNEAFEHTLLYGNPGLGKTTLAHIIAKEMGGSLVITSGPSLERVGDLAAILSNLQQGDVLFIDEIHRINKTIEEALYPAMEDYALDIILGKGPAARTLRMPLAKFTLIGATTRMSLLSGPLRDRFGHTFHLQFYEAPDIEHILRRSARILETPLDDTACALIASRARRTPRVANRLLRRIRDFAQIGGDGAITEEQARYALDRLQVDPLGLEETDRLILRAIIEKFDGGPVGLQTIAAATAEDVSTVEEVYEPFLMQIGFIERTPKGRCATRLAYEHLGFPAPAKPATLI